MEDKGSTKEVEVEAKVVPMVVAPMQPDAPGFSTLPATPPALSPPDSTDSELSTKTKMERQEVDLGPSSNARCFILTDVLTPTECARLIHAAKRAATNDRQDGGGGWEKLSRLFASEYRGGDRLLVMDEPLAHELWQRIKPGLTRDDVLRVRPIGFGNAGTWRPFRLNECLKLVRYKPGDHFSGHVDGPWVPKLDESSIYTVIVYLNDDYKGGCTNFRSENTQELLWRVTPRAGQALIFNHDTYHEGEPVLEGVKYILRTEMMFQRVDTGAVVARDDYLAKPTYRKLVKVYEKSNDAIDQGDVQVFVEKYLQAIQLQRDEQRSLGEDKRKLASELALPYEIYVKIFALLSPTEIARLQLVSKLWYDLARDGPLWKKLYQTRWRTLSPTGPSELQVSNAEIEDWYGCWKTRTSYERATHSTVVAVDCGGHSIKCARTTTSLGTYQTLSDRSVITTIREAHAWHYRAPVRHYYGEAGLRQRGDQVTWLVRRGNVLLMSSVTAMVLNCLERLAVFKPSPIVFCVPPTWDKEWNLLPRTVQRFASPFLCAEDSGVLVLASYGKRTGIVVDVGFEVISISPVYEGKLLRQFVALSRRTSSQAPSTAALVWASDNNDDESQCPNCLRSFTFMVRRHHCRACGVVRCRTCMVRTADGRKLCERCRGDAPKPHQAPATSKPDQWEEEQDTAAALADGTDSPSRESYKVAASLLISVLRRLHRHQNGPQLNLIDLDSLRHNVVITGGGSMEAGWDADFECELGRLAAEQSTPSHTLHQVDPARKEQRVFDAAQGACMMVDARSHAPFDNIFQHVTIKTPTA